MFFWMTPALTIVAVYVAAAVLPAIVLLRYIYRHDTVEKEPANLLVSLLLAGVLSALGAGVLEMIGETVLYLLVKPDSPFYTILLAFLVVAAAEEGMKFYFLKRRTWNDPNFNYRFDAIVYAVFVSLGFAAFENIQYIFRFGLSVALPRAISAVPGHMAFAVFMGVFYGRAKLYADSGYAEESSRALRHAYLTAVLLHGVYDTCAMIGSGLSTLVFVIFVAVMFLAVYRVVRIESDTDSPV